MTNIGGQKAWAWTDKGAGGVPVIATENFRQFLVKILHFVRFR